MRKDNTFTVTLTVPPKLLAGFPYLGFSFGFQMFPFWFLVNGILSSF